MTRPFADRLTVLKSIDMAEDMLSLARVPGTEQIYAGAFNGLVYHADLSAETPQAQPLSGGHVSFVSAIAVWKDIVVSAGSDHRLVWWNRQTHEKIRTVNEAHAKWIRDIAVHPDQGVLVSVGDDMFCRLWDLETGELIVELKGHADLTPHHFRNKLFACRFSRDGAVLATADQTGRVVIRNVATRGELAVVDASKFYEWDFTAEEGNGHSYGGIRALDFSPDGSQLAVAGIFNTDAAITNGQALLHVYDWRAGKMTAEYTGGGNFFYENVRFHHSGDWIVATPGAGGAETHVNFFHSGEARLLKKTEGMRIYDLELNDTSDIMYVAGPKKIARLGIYASADQG